MLDYDEIKLSSFGLCCAYIGVFPILRNIYQENEKFIGVDKKEGPGDVFQR